MQEYPFYVDEMSNVAANWYIGHINRDLHVQILAYTKNMEDLQMLWMELRRPAEYWALLV